MNNPFLGIQVEPHLLLDEGPEHSLDLMQSTAGINALLIYTHTYYGPQRRGLEALAGDHGVTPRNERTHPVAQCWVPPDPARFGGLELQHLPEKGVDYCGVGIFDEVGPVARDRGLRVFGRILEPRGKKAAQNIAGWSQVASRHIDGSPAEAPDRAHPAWGAFWATTVSDAIAQGQLDGFQFGSESIGPLSGVLLDGSLPWGFGEHEVAAGRARGIEPERARTGYSELHQLMSSRDPEAAPDGLLTEVLRVLFAFPEVMAWERMGYDLLLDFYRQIFQAARETRPDVEVGVHVDHQQSSYDPFCRVLLDTRRLAEFSGFIKPILYHDIAGPRLRNTLVNRMGRHAWRDFSPETLRDFFFSFFGYDGETEPGIPELDGQGMSADYVLRQTRRMVLSAAGRCAIYPGIGVDIPRVGTGDESAVRFPSDPEGIAAAVEAAFAGGADGIVISREYGEMRRAGLEAVGQVVRRKFAV